MLPNLQVLYVSGCVCLSTFAITLCCMLSASPALAHQMLAHASGSVQLSFDLQDLSACMQFACACHVTA